MTGMQQSSDTFNHSKQILVIPVSFTTLPSQNKIKKKKQIPYESVWNSRINQTLLNLKLRWKAGTTAMIFVGVNCVRPCLQINTKMEWATVFVRVFAGVGDGRRGSAAVEDGSVVA